MRVVVVLGLLCGIASAAPPGMAEEEPPRPPVAARALAPTEPVGPPVEAYRAQTILADCLAGTFLFIAANSSSQERGEAFAKLSLTTYIFGAPIVHLTKNRGKHALGSITMRVAFPFVGMLVGGAMNDSNDCYDSCTPQLTDEMAYGALAGAVAASALDAIYLAKGEPGKPIQSALTPTVRSTRGGVAFGLAGSF